DEARCYAMLQLLAAVSTWLFLRWYDAPGAGRLWLYSGSVALVCLTHYYAFAVPVVHGLSLLATSTGRRRIPTFLSAAALAAGMFAFWMPSFFAQLGTQGNLARGGDRWTLQFLGTPLVFGFGRLLVWSGSQAWQLGAASIAAVVLLWVP